MRTDIKLPYYLNFRIELDLMDAIMRLDLNTPAVFLCGNKLGSMTVDEIRSILQALPVNLKGLDLSDNSLYNKTDEELIAIIEVFRGKALIELKLDDCVMSRPAVKAAYDAIIGVNGHNALQKERGLLETMLSELTPPSDPVTKQSPLSLARTVYKPAGHFSLFHSSRQISKTEPSLMHGFLL
ncbi:hypothetical protein [Legionella worsleiensis]|uniref:Leucine-rich repeat-containing protein n=1 Tax=Legionella worsleiensis TaxID=45076 RepID=A0A0W1AHS4_9GAMM|nr:hypothetical protein [Legionella worsleiensis]KTD80707.1 hypothetical protein Lwor_0950 [Legionella worsleiensis]STY32715.1 Uncharacterised protein [Legionella worsleiensis]